MTDFLQDNPTGVILSMDEMSLYFQATVTQVWSPVGQTPQVYVSGSRDHTHFYGALNLQTVTSLPFRLLFSPVKPR